MPVQATGVVMTLDLKVCVLNVEIDNVIPTIKSCGYMYILFLVVEKLMYALSQCTDSNTKALMLFIYYVSVMHTAFLMSTLYRFTHCYSLYSFTHCHSFYGATH